MISRQLRLTFSKSLLSRSFCTGSLFSAEMTLPEKEKEMFKVKRKMGLLFNQGNYSESLNAATLLEKQVKETFGTKTSVHASCLNNIALMHKVFFTVNALL